MVKVSGFVVVAKAKKPVPFEINVVELPLNLFPPVDELLFAPVLVKLAVPVNFDPLRYTSAELTVRVAEIVVPANVLFVPVVLNVPLVIAPALQVTVPEAVRVNPPKFRVPEVIVRLVTPATPL